MDEFDKVEKLRQRANVSYEEARDALRACNGDLLDAMVYLEKLGHVKAPEKSTVSTSSEEKEHYENVPEAVVRSQSTASDPSFGQQLGILIKTALRKSIDNFIVVSHKGEEKFRLPILVAIILLFMFNVITLTAVIVSLFFDVNYRFEGKDDLSKMNNVINQAGTRASEWMAETTAKGNEKKAENQGNVTSEAKDTKKDDVKIDEMEELLRKYEAELKNKNDDDKK